jgi:hypothetical protein
MSPPSREGAFDDDPPSAQDIALAILLEAESLPQLMELHYYAGEPGFLEIVRALAALPEDAREDLRKFLAATDRHRIQVRRDGSRLIVERVAR